LKIALKRSRRALAQKRAGFTAYSATNTGFPAFTNDE
jgi:hypothetical protein